MNSTRNIAVGVFVLIGLLCTAYLTIKLGRMEVFDAQSFQLEARFSSVAGLRVGAGVELAGVHVGRVSSISLTPTFEAVVTLALDEALELTDDTIASIKTSGLIGDKYISLAPGASDVFLSNGDEIIDTEAPVDLESLISKFAFGGV